MAYHPNPEAMLRLCRRLQEEAMKEPDRAHDEFDQRLTERFAEMAEETNRKWRIAYIVFATADLILATIAIILLLSQIGAPQG